MAGKLHVGGLAFETNDEGLQAFFAQAGDVKSATVIRERESGRSRGFGFVEMATGAEGSKAVNDLDGQTLDGNAITVAKAKAKPAGGERRGGGNRRR